MTYVQFTPAGIRLVREALVTLEQTVMLDLKKNGTGDLHKKYNAVNSLRKEIDTVISTEENRDASKTRNRR